MGPLRPKLPEIPQLRLPLLQLPELQNEPLSSKSQNPQLGVKKYTRSLLQRASEQMSPLRFSDWKLFEVRGG